MLDYLLKVFLWKSFIYAICKLSVRKSSNIKKLFLGYYLGPLPFNRNIYMSNIYGNIGPWMDGCLAAVDACRKPELVKFSATIVLLCCISFLFSQISLFVPD